MLRFDILTIFPLFFGSAEPASGLLGHGVLRRALLSQLVSVHVSDLRALTSDRHRTVDDRPFGGGEGMVLKPEPIAQAVASTGVLARPERDPKRESVILLSASGELFHQRVARELSSLERIVLICGRYEGVDERIATHVADRELSVGDFVISGGELAAALVLDAIARLVPGVLGNAASAQFESFGPADTMLGAPQGPPPGGVLPITPPQATYGTGGLLDYPHYTRPAVWDGAAVPEVLMGGDHAEVRAWRRQQSLAKTLRHRPELIEQARVRGELSDADERFLRDFREG